MAAGDFDDDGFDDLVVGVSHEDLGEGLEDAGAVNVVYGAAGSGLGTAGNQFLNQNTRGVQLVAEAGDNFGFGLAWR